MSNAAKNVHPIFEDSRLVKNSNSGHLISKYWDVLLIGGGSLVLLVLTHFMLKHENPTSSISWFVFNLSFVANFPHFLVSYQLLYVDHGKKIFKERSFLWAAVIAPAIILGVMITGFLGKNPHFLGYLVNSMYFFVGWHYVKQIFGGITVTNALQKYYYNSNEKLILKANLFSLWAISFFSFNIGEKNYVQDGINYSSLNFPDWILTAAYWALGISVVGVILMNISKYIREGQWPSSTAIACFLSIYAWYLPVLSHPMYKHTIPFFHSLQYLLFVYVFRKNKVTSQIENLNSPEGRAQKLRNIFGYFLAAALLGATLMYFLPRYLDTLNLHDKDTFGPTAFYFSFIVFINIHHYFIDNVIWRGNNEEIKKHLFKS